MNVSEFDYTEHHLYSDLNC